MPGRKIFITEIMDSCNSKIGMEFDTYISVQYLKRIFGQKCKHFLLVLPTLPTKILHQFNSFILSWRISAFYHFKKFSLFYKENKNLFLIVLVTIYIYSPFFLLYYSHIILVRKVPDSGIYSQMISLLAASFYMSFFQQIFFTL